MVRMVCLRQDDHQGDHCRCTISNIFNWLAERQQRILSYASHRDRVFLGASIVASVLAGSTLPLMNIIFGKLDKHTSPSPTRLTSISTTGEDIHIVHDNSE